MADKIFDNEKPGKKQTIPDFVDEQDEATNCSLVSLYAAEE